MSTFTYRGKSRTGGTTSMFISRWDTTQAGSANDTIIFPFVADGDYDFYVDWGDGTRDNITTYNQAEVTHQYSNTGIYEVRIYGGITGWQFNNAGDKAKIIEISNWGPLSVIDRSIFDGCSNLELTTTDALDLSNVNSLRESFRNCSSIGTQGNIGSWDVSNISRIRNCFNGCSNFDQDLSNWDVSIFGSGNDEGNGLFSNCTNFNNGGSPGISGWNTTNWDGSAGMNDMFSSCSSFNQPVGTWDVSSVTSMSRMFRNCTVFDQDLSDWDVSNVTSMSDLFINTAFNNGGQTGIYNWDVSSCISFIETFSNADNFNQDIGGWTFATGLDKNISCFRMFQNNGGFNNGGSPAISGWNTSRVTNMQQMFNSCSSFNQPVGTWDTSSVTTMDSMFANADSFNQPIGNWDVSSCTDFDRFLDNQAVFDQDLSNWQLYTGLDDTIAMNSMFRNCPFNNSGQPGISGWNTSRVSDMGKMFDDNSTFNQPIGSWDTSSVTSMSRMFEDSSAFDQDLSNWIVTGVTVFGSSFMRSVTLSTENYDRTLSGWAQQSGDLQTGLQISFGNSQYSVATGQQYKDILTGNPVLWSITDGGSV